MKHVAGVDLGGTAVNATIADGAGRFLIDGLCEHPSLAVQGPAICIQQMEEALDRALALAGLTRQHLAAVGLDTPGPASATGVLSAEGSTNFVHPNWGGFDIRSGLEARLGLPVTYLNDGNAGALWGHYTLFGDSATETSLSAIIGTGLGGGVIVNGRDVRGHNGFAGELGHVLVPYQSIPGIEGLVPRCNCGRVGDLESLCSLTAIRNSLLPYFLQRYPGHPLAALDLREAAKQVRALAEAGDPLARDIFRVQAHALGLFFDLMVNIFDPDALIIGGGAIEASPALLEWFLTEVRHGMPPQREQQAGVPIHIMPNGDTAGARGAAVDALHYARQHSLL